MDLLPHFAPNATASFTEEPRSLESASTRRILQFGHAAVTMLACKAIGCQPQYGSGLREGFDKDKAPKVVGHEYGSALPRLLQYPWLGLRQSGGAGEQHGR